MKVTKKLRLLALCLILSFFPMLPILVAEEVERDVSTPFSLDADYFYYTDTTVGTAYLSQVNPNYVIGEGDTFRLEILDGENVCYETSTSAFSNVEIRFPVSALGVVLEDYKLKISYQKASETAFTLCQNIFKVDRPSMIDKEGRFIVNGGYFTPHTAWTTKEAKHYRIAKRLGCNVGTSAGVEYSPDEENIQAYKDKIDDMYYNYGLMVCVTYHMPSFVGHETYFTWLEKMVQMLYNHPGIFAWVLMDEPSLHPDFCDVDALLRGYKIVRKYDSVHPVMCTEPNIRWFKDAGKSCDFLVVDPYPSADKWLATMFQDRGTAARDALRQNKPITSVIRAYRTIGSTSANNPNFEPDANFIRYSFFEWLRLGTDGIAAYNLAAGSDPSDITNRPGIWQAYEHFVKYEMQDVLKSMVEGELPIFFQVQKDGTSVYYYGYVSGKKLHVIVMNRTGNNQTVSIPLVSYNGNIQIDGFTATADPFADLDPIPGNGNLEASLTPYQVIHFEVEPHDDVSFDGLGMTRLCDLADFGWAKDAIIEVLEKSVMDTPKLREFFPAREITRGEFASALVRALDIRGEGANFTDVEAWHPFADDIKKGKAAGILEGYDDGTFRPDNTITGQEIMSICAHAIRKARGPEDVASDYIMADIAAHFKEGIIQGRGDSLPNLSATRAEAAVLLCRVMKWKEAAWKAEGFEALVDSAVDKNGASILTTLLIDADGTGNVSGSVYANKKTIGNKTYVVIQNTGNVEASYALSVETDEGVMILSGEESDDTVSIFDGLIRFTLAPHALLFLQIGDPAPGLYNGNIRLRALRNGSFTLRGATLAALYEEAETGNELISLFTADEPIVISGTEEKPMVFKAFSWDESLSPSDKSYVLR